MASLTGANLKKGDLKMEKNIYPKKFDKSTLNHIKRIVERCNVGDAIEDVNQYVYSRFKKNYIKDMPEKLLKDLNKHIKDCHNYNFVEYLAVMSGKI